jgi:hypothetical protein
MSSLQNAVKARKPEDRKAREQKEGSNRQCKMEDEDNRKDAEDGEGKRGSRGKEQKKN